MLADPVVLWQVALSGIVIGLVFALVAVGLTLIFGVMDVVNFAHGEYLMLGMYGAYWLWVLFALDPLVSAPLCAALLAALGVATYYLLIRRVLGGPMLAQIFATFGLSLFLRAVAQFLWSPDYRRIGPTLSSGRVELFGAYLGTAELVAAGGALLCTLALFAFLRYTETGRALAATAEDREVAMLMGIDAGRMYALAWALGAACVGIAGALLAAYFPIFPDVGTIWVLTAFVTVALGGFGSVTGALIAGVLIGLLQVAGGFVVQPAYKYVPVLAVYLAVVLLRPQGLLGSR